MKKKIKKRKKVFKLPQKLIPANRHLNTTNNKSEEIEVGLNSNVLLSCYLVIFSSDLSAGIG